MATVRSTRRRWSKWCAAPARTRPYRWSTRWWPRRTRAVRSKESSRSKGQSLAIAIIWPTFYNSRLMLLAIFLHFYDTRTNSCEAVRNGIIWLDKYWVLVLKICVISFVAFCRRWSDWFRWVCNADAQTSADRYRLRAATGLQGLRSWWQRLDITGTAANVVYSYPSSACILSVHSVEQSFVPESIWHYHFICHFWSNSSHYQLEFHIIEH